MRRLKAGAVLGMASLVMLGVLPLAAVAQSDDVKVTVVIERVVALSHIDTTSEADFYAKIWVDGRFHRTTVVTGDTIEPNWTFETSFPQTRREVPVKIELWDEDDFLNGADDLVDITEGPGSALEVMLHFEPCHITGPVEGPCHQTLFTRGHGSDRASMRFRLEAEGPATPDNLFVRCLHSPLWPQPGDRLTISAEPLAAVDSALATRRADGVEIWYDVTSLPQHIAPQSTGTSRQTPPLSAGTFAYGCRITENGISVFSGWRLVQVGQPSSGKAVPVIYNGRAEQGVDVLFVPNGDDYTGIDTAFLNDMTTVLRDGVYGNNAYLRHQNRLNIWLAPDTGEAGGWTVDPSGGGTCTITLPENMADYTFADATGVMHRSGSVVRDCATGGVFTGRVTNPRVVAHEIAHAPFGLADEYCCDGAYWQATQDPNIYSTESACAADAPPGATCRSFTAVISGDTFWTSDPATNDLMVDNRWANFLDMRRIKSHFDRCSDAC